MEHRIQRFVIPATIILMTIVIILLIAGVPIPIEIIGIRFSDFIQFIIAIGVTFYGLGYLCNVIFTCYMFICDKERFIDVYIFLKSIGIIDNKSDMKKLNNHRKCKKLIIKEALSEFHIRLHSHAPEELLNHLSRRNTGWYIAKASSIASIIGLIFGIIIIANYYKGYYCLNQIIRAIGAGLFIFLLAKIMWMVGTKWNREYWDVANKWIKWDNSTNSNKPWIEYFKRRIRNLK